MRRPVAFFLPSLGGGGAERCMLTLAQGFASEGLEVDMLLATANGPYLSQVTGKLRIVDLKSKSIWTCFPELTRYIARERPVALISALEHANFVALIANRFSGTDTRVVVTTHTMVSMAARAAKRPAVKALPLLMRLLYPLADSIVAVSRAVASDISRLTGLPESRVDVVYNPVPVTSIANLAREPVANEWLNADGPPLVISVGSFWPHKDHRTLLQAFDIARRRKPLRLAILGDGPERVNLEALAHQLGLQGAVVMPGFVKNPYAWIARSAVFVLPSRWEGFGMGLVEALACGVTPIATDCPGGITEVLENGRYGRIVPVGDPVALADSVLAVVDEPLQAESLKQRAETFSVSQAVVQYEVILGLKPDS